MSNLEKTRISILVRLTMIMIITSTFVSGITNTAIPVFAYTKLCSGSSYSACTNKGYTDHGYGSNNQNSYWGAYPGHNCTNYVAYVETQNGVPRPSFHLGNANQWWSEAQGHVTESTTTPVITSVAWWDAYHGGSGKDGHVAYVEAVSGNPGSYTITISEDAYPSGPFDWVKIAQGDSRWPGGFIYFDGSQGGGGQATPPVSISFNGDLNVFKIGGDGQVYQDYWTGTKWTGWASIQGSTAKSLAVIINGSALNIFQLNANGQIYTEYNAGNGWSGWASLGGHAMAGTPAVIIYSPSQMDIFDIDTNKVPYVDKWTSSGWSGWTSMGNYMASGASPAAIMYVSSEMDLFYLGGDNNIYQNKTFDGSIWSGFFSLGAPSGTTIVGDPFVMNYPPEGEFDVYINTMSGHIYKRMFNGSWTGWADMGGNFVGKPYAVQYGSDMNLFARGTDDKIYQRYWSYGGQFWSGWGSLGGNLASDPDAIQYGSSELDVFATDGNNNTYHDTFFPSSGWGGFSQL